MNVGARSGLSITDCPISSLRLCDLPAPCNQWVCKLNFMPCIHILFSCLGNYSALCSPKDCFHHGPLRTAGGDPCVSRSINHSYGLIWTKLGNVARTPLLPFILSLRSANHRGCQKKRSCHAAKSWNRTNFWWNATRRHYAVASDQNTTILRMEVFHVFLISAGWLTGSVSGWNRYCHIG